VRGTELTPRAAARVTGLCKLNTWWAFFNKRVGDYIMRDLLPPAQQACLTAVLDLLRLLAAESVILSSLVVAEADVQRLMRVIEGCLPKSEIAICMHLLNHATRVMRTWGPMG
jgi:hypothetical protein